MIKKKLEPLKKPQNFNQVTNNDSTVVSCLAQLIKLQKKTIDLLENKNIPKNMDNSVISNLSPIQHKKFNDPIIDHTTFRQKPLVSLEGQLQRQQQLQFPQQAINIQQQALNFTQQNGAVIKTALTQKIPNHDKKNYNVLNEFLQYTDRRQYKILISFQSFAKQFPIITNVDVLQKITVQWIGDVFRMVASMCWNMMLNSFLNYQETKILFTQNIIYNYIEYMNALQNRGFAQYKHRLTSLINKKSINILDFLGKQFPQTKIQVPNIRLKQILPNTNNSSRMKFDVVTIANRKGFEIRYKNNGNYAAQIMTLINFIIDQTNESYPEYQKEILHIFQQVFKLPDRRQKPSQQNQIMKGKNSQIQIQTSEDIMYRQKVKKYTKFLIGRKVNKNVPKFTRQEINNGLFFPKSPSILRIITKWVQELTQLIKSPQQHILSADKQLKSHEGNFVVLFSRVRQGVCDKIIQNREKLFKKIESIKQECFYIQSILSSPAYTQDSSQLHLSEDQISVGKFSVCVQKAISSYIFQQLNQILHFLLKIPFEVDETKLGVTEDFHQSEVRKQLDKLNLVNMKIFDLLRCKCISNEEEIIWIMNYLIDRNLVGDFKLVRVKDRLNQGTRDINCNLRFKKGCLLSQMQLSVVSNFESKQEKLDSYNHFLYELKRSKLGPLSENVSIWTVLQQRSLYFQNINKKSIPQKPTLHTCSNQNLQKFIRPICCDSCNNFYPYPQTVYSNVRCKKCKKTYCGQCYSIVLNNEDKKSMIFEGMFKQHVLHHIKNHNDPDKPFPMEGIYLKRYHERREINYFTVLIKNIKTQQPMSFESIKQVNNSPKQVQCFIIFTHNAIRNDKTVQKQKNIGRTIRATIRNEKQIYINKKDYSFFNQYLIFYFDQKFQPSYMTLDQIEIFLKTQQNHSLKVLNIMEDPVYVEQIKYLRKKSQKLRQLDKLKNWFKSTPTQKFLCYQFGKIFIVAKVYKDSLQLGYSINYANNMVQLKQHALAQKSIVSMQKHNIREQFNDLQAEINRKIAQSLYKNLRKLYLNYNSLENLQGLKHFVSLEVLYVRHNNLTSLKGVEGKKDLILLRVDDNKIQDLQPLRQLYGLKRLMGSDNKIKSLEPIKNLTLLKTLQFQKNQIDSLQPIKDLQDLQDINFKLNPGIKHLPQLLSKNIKSIAFSGTSINQLSTIGKYKKTKRLLLQGLKLKQIPQFVKDLKLNELWLGDNEITRLNNLQGQDELQILSLKNNKVNSLIGVDVLQSVKILYMDNNEIVSLQGVKVCFETLKQLSLKQNSLDDVKLIIYADETMKFDYSRDRLTQKARVFLDELYLAKVNSSGSQD